MGGEENPAMARRNRWNSNSNLNSTSISDWSSNLNSKSNRNSNASRNCNSNLNNNTILALTPTFDLEEIVEALIGKRWTCSRINSLQIGILYDISTFDFCGEVSFPV